MRNALVLAISVALIAVALAASPQGNPAFHFAERKIVTWTSALLLLATGGLLLRSAQRLREGEGRWLFWEVSGWGFVYLAFDEHFQYHERMGKMLERSLDLQAQPWMNHLDDGIVMAYGLAAAAICWVFREEVLAHPRSLPPLGAAFAFLAAMAGVDAFAPDTAPYRAAEESLKLLAVSLFFLWALEARPGRRTGITSSRRDSDGFPLSSS